MSQTQLLSLIRKDARRIAKHFHLKYLEIRTELPQVRKRFGSCDQDRIIRLRLHNLRNGRWLTYSNLIHTLCHELAHLKHMNHGNKFKELNKELLLWAKNRGIYYRG